jgi:hypothetical protein
MGYNSKLSCRNHSLSSFERVSTIALESTQPLTEISIRNLPGVKERPAHKANKPNAICEPKV